MSALSTLVPIGDILHLLKVISCNEEATIEKLATLIEQDLNSFDKPIENLKALNYFMLYIKNCQISTDLLEKTLKSCLNFLCSTTPNDLFHINLIGSVLDSCLSMNDSPYGELAYSILFNFIKDKLSAQEFSKIDGLEIDTSLIHSFLIAEKLCNLQNLVLKYSKNSDMLVFQENIFCKITDLILSQQLETSKTLLTKFLPKFMGLQDDTYLLNFWGFLEELDSSDHLEKQLFYLCLLSNNYICLLNSSSTYPLYKKPKFWVIIQMGLISSDNINRKMALYLLRIYVSLFQESGMNCDEEDFFWSIDCKENLILFWEKLFLLLETLEEKQIHVITPALKSLPDVYLLCNTNVRTCYSWLLCLFQRILCHSSATLVKWGLQEFCTLNTDMVFSDKKCVNLLSSFFNSLNNMFLYSLKPSDEGSLQNSLVNLFISISESDVKMAFEILLRVLVDSPWSPIPLFFITDSLSKLPKQHLLDENCLNLIKKILLETIKTQCVFIRSAIQSRLLRCISQLAMNVIDMCTLINLLGSFNGEESLLRGTGTWDNCVEWLKNLTNTNAGPELITLCSKRLFTCEHSSISIHSFARSVILFLDAGILKPNLEFETFLNLVFEQFLDCEKRTYASHCIQDNSLEFIKYVIDESNIFLCDSEKGGIIESVDKIHFLLCYIELRLKRGTINSLESVKLYISVLESIFSHSSLLKDVEFISLYKTCFNILERKDVSFLQEFLSCKILYIIFEFIVKHHLNENRFIEPFNKNILNDLFMNRLFNKEAFSFPSPSSVLNLRGRLISEIMETLWSIFDVFLLQNVNNVKIIISKFDTVMLMDSALNAVCEDGKQAFVPILKSFSKLIQYNENTYKWLELIELSWRACFELRKSDLFWPAITEWIKMVFQEKILLSVECSAAVKKYSKEIIILGEELTGLVDILMSHLSCVNVPLDFSFIITDGLIFGSITRKDKRIEYEVCHYIFNEIENGLIESFGKQKTIRNNKEVRIKALNIIFNIKNDDQRNHFIISVIDELLNIDSLLTKNSKRYFNDSLVHRKKHRILQAILVLNKYVSNVLSTGSQSFVIIPQKLFQWAYESLQGSSQQPSVRYQLEWLLIWLCLTHSNLLANFFELFEQAGNERVGSLCSFISIAFHLAIVLNDEVFYRKCFESIIPWCMSQNFNIRLYSQVVLKKLWSLNLGILENFNFLERSMWKIYEQGNLLVNAKKMLSDFYFDCFHPVNHFSLQTIFWDLPRLSNISSEEWIHPEALKKYSLLMKICSDSPALLSLENYSSPNWISRVPGDSVEDLEMHSIQKKFIPWKGVLSDSEDRKNLPKSGLILVASLINKAANLGGLARTSEIFAVKELVIPNLEIMKDKEFLGLSMTAEKHISISEVKSYKLLEYLQMMKSLGYALVGLEQTTGSVSLNSFKFPRDCILLLGNEREGIPANLIPFMDFCVEIPQMGVIRSLNVHVSGALFIWEYSKQHLPVTYT